MKKEIKEILNDQEPKFNKNTKEFGIFIKLGDLRKLKEYIEELENSKTDSNDTAWKRFILRIRENSDEAWNVIAQYSDKQNAISGYNLCDMIAEGHPLIQLIQVDEDSDGKIKMTLVMEKRYVQG